MPERPDSMSDLETLRARLRFVLVRTSHPGNIGGAARAIRTMGFTRLHLVDPARFPDPEAYALAASADAVLDQAVVSPQLTDALTGSQLVLGLSARRRDVHLPELTPEQAATKAWQAAAAGQEVSLIFGNERTGLENDELARCHAMVMIPSVEDYSSLNLAQAVQVMAYELRKAGLAEAPAVPTPTDEEPPADAALMERFYQHLAQTLDDIEFHKGRAPETIMLRLRRLFQRARPDARELRILHGVLADAQRMAQLAGKAGNA
ncbi:RNA methyltransferase, TrmH family, group 1 [Frateuria aurantia DSM 6220]|uniref:tRNA (cytidine/uridine-2'-O-)-methyltransferase TrmJ n=2 Tax=Frateuria aurantia TaxID=81475 RepID=H8L5P7_FRAAD|nr:RNA methyltransferase, TrmH family, group 1 [Frateuria aurantia DSM 6220]